jgi:thiol-activated cytolysin
MSYSPADRFIAALSLSDGVERTSMRSRARHGLWGIAIIAIGCSGGIGDTLPGDEGEVPFEEQVFEEDDVDGYILAIPHFELPEAMPKTELDCEDVCPADGQDGDEFCVYERYGATAHSSEFVAFQPNSATLWPGSVLRGDDAANGLLTPVGVDLAPVTFSASLENLGGSPVGHMEEPSLSSFREQRNAILANGVHGATPASLTFEVVEVHESSQLSVELGAGIDWPGAGDIATSFDFESTERKTKILVNFTQAYYTIDVDTHTSPADFFVDGTTIDDLDPYMDEASPPLYVQSITYGRRVIFALESNDSAEKVATALAATYSGIVDVNLEIETEHQEILSSSTIKAFVLGGSGSDATGIINGFEGLVTYIEEGGDYSADSPGAPIAYKLAYLDNSVTALAFTTDYVEKNCYQNQGTIRVELTSVENLAGGDASGGLEIYGQVGIRYPVDGNPVVSCSEGGVYENVWDLGSSSWVSIPKMGMWLPSSPPTLNLHDIPFGPDQMICLHARFREVDDFSGDDDFGETWMELTWDDHWAGDHAIQTHGDDEGSMEATVHVSLE